MNELDTVVLTRDIKDRGLKKGDMGAIVQVYKRSLQAPLIKRVRLLKLSL